MPPLPLFRSFHTARCLFVFLSLFLLPLLAPHATPTRRFPPRERDTLTLFLSLSLPKVTPEPPSPPSRWARTKSCTARPRSRRRSTAWTLSRVSGSLPLHLLLRLLTLLLTRLLLRIGVSCPSSVSLLLSSPLSTLSFACAAAGGSCLLAGMGLTGRRGVCLLIRCDICFSFLLFLSWRGVIFQRMSDVLRFTLNLYSWPLERMHFSLIYPSFYRLPFLRFPHPTSSMCGELRDHVVCW